MVSEIGPMQGGAFWELQLVLQSCGDVMVWLPIVINFHDIP
jgi:hypothetical protein